MAITTVIVSGLLPLAWTAAQDISSSVQAPDTWPTPIPKPTPTPTPPPSQVPTIVTLGWDPSPDTTVIGYRILMGTQSQNYVAKITLGNQTSVKVLINHPTTYFVVTAYTAAGLESSPSGELVLTW